MKQIFGLILFTLFSAQTFAANECKEFKNSGDLFEAMKTTRDVVASSEELTGFYRKTNLQLKSFIGTTCDAGMDYTEMINEGNRMCATACVQHSKVTKYDSKKFLKDCSSVCEGARASQNLYKTKLKEQKKNADTAKPTKESIADLKREAKELDLELNGPRVPQKSKKVNAK